jgi:hypothetical protein
MLLTGVTWAGLVLFTLLCLPFLEGPLFDAELNFAQGDFIARYALVTQYWFIEQLAVFVAIVVAGLWISTKLLPAYRKGVVRSVLFGSFLTAVSALFASPAGLMLVGDMGYLRGLPLPWLIHTRGVGSFGLWVTSINFFLVVDILIWASISYLVMFAAMRFFRGKARTG